jgi:hypothetical protein
MSNMEFSWSRGLARIFRRDGELRIAATQSGNGARPGS